MDVLSKKIFDRRRVNPDKLSAFGFVRNDSSGNSNVWSYHTTLTGCNLEMNVTLTLDRGDTCSINAVVIDPDFNEPYTLHLTSNIGGSFVSNVRSEYEKTLLSIAESCFDVDVFKSTQTRELISHVRETYGDELEFLWPKFSDNAIWRRKDTQKWYGVILTIVRGKLGFVPDAVDVGNKSCEEIVEIIDLRCSPKELPTLIDGRKYLPGWHMNKKSWYTIVLDDSVSTDEICDRIAVSYQLAVK